MLRVSCWHTQNEKFRFWGSVWTISAWAPRYCSWLWLVPGSNSVVTHGQSAIKMLFSCNLLLFLFSCRWWRYVTAHSDSKVKCDLCMASLTSKPDLTDIFYLGLAYLLTLIKSNMPDIDCGLDMKIPVGPYFISYLQVAHLEQYLGKYKLLNPQQLQTKPQRPLIHIDRRCQPTHIHPEQTLCAVLIFSQIHLQPTTAPVSAKPKSPWTLCFPFSGLLLEGFLSSTAVSYTAFPSFFCQTCF